MNRQIDKEWVIGTGMLDLTVGELVGERPGRSRVFQEFGMGFCCQGKVTLREACERKGVAVEEMLERLEAEQAGIGGDGEDAVGLEPEALIGYIVERHHGYLRRELPRLHAMAQRVAHVHGGHTPSLVGVYEEFEGLFRELDSHMKKEEQVLFPAVVALVRGEGGLISLEGPMAVMVDEHEEVVEVLSRLRAMTGGYCPPADACNTYRALFDGLRELDDDLQRHIQLENEVLFPAAAMLALG